MKTVRYSTFETNSSSTHAFTVNPVDLANKPDLNIIPDENGCIVLGLCGAESGVPQEKIGHLLKYANSIGDQDAFDRVRKVVEEFTGAQLIVKTKQWSGSKMVSYEDLRVVTNEKIDFEEEEDIDNLIDEWYSYTHAYGHGGVSEFCSVMNEICSTEENIRIFIFSSKQSVYSETYYD